MSSSDVDAGPLAAEHLAALIRIPTVSASPTGVDATTHARAHAAHIAELHAVLSEMYPRLHAATTVRTIGRTGRLWHLPGGGTAAGARPTAPLVLMAHADVVPADEADGWTHPPFAGVVRDGTVFGRGTLDDKGALVVALEAFEGLLTEAWTPPRDVLVWVGGDEEVFGSDAREFAAWLREQDVRPWLVLDEGGAVVDAPLPFIDVEAAMVGVGEKGVMAVRLEATGDPGHASAPAGRSATERIARAVLRLRARPFPARLPEPARAMLRAFVPHATGPSRQLLRLLVAVPALTAFLFARLGGDAAALVRTTVAPTMLRGGTAVNVLPSTASATLNLRLALGTSTASAARRIARVVGDRSVRVVVMEREEATPAAPSDNAQFAAIRDAVAQAYPGAVVVPYIALAATDARHLQRDALETYRFAPLRMSTAQRATIHGVDERVEVDALARGVRFFRALLEDLR
ncbi:M20/M25/M40 family metallo-hydrolase [Pseudoclavibacter chungangensis]|uniref:M20/M25/M40 family metallo-hydrolase n=1 Tax=Pseudoclavibacter chungangensis TaxID=587635 RepID=A0A7J5C1W5_9MICO|nr:M20/M25/M40 family metallo-hydrolase [Pseudoclavibacter chungangensis]KAB1662604.1 M20/M25/M40 family metallo-hydrolase [Pseudoclavibacter chungangensis]NYJ68653.1 carboxypeptidase PM20D1 [Pseudoclavibacter chungangensis]